MMPIINRGTWTRVHSVRTLIDNFIDKFKDGKVQILSLGAGFDTNFFYYEENVEVFRDNNVKYFEVDFQDITSQKITTIRDNPELERLIFKDESAHYDSEDTLLTPKYKLIPCDIRDTDLLEERLTQANLDPTSATLVLAECVLCYMENCDSAKILSWLTNFFTSNIAIVNFEMIKPNDAFGHTMVENLEARGCHLLGLKDVPDEDAQVNRMLE
jgi:tRNA wybutosine-synthesizing protein 4